jgi:hypothetical protein
MPECGVIATVERRFDILTLAALPDLSIFGPLTSDPTMEIVSIRPTISFGSFHAKIASLELPASVEDWIHNYCREHFAFPRQRLSSPFTLFASGRGRDPRIRLPTLPPTERRLVATTAQGACSSPLVITWPRETLVGGEQIFAW